MKSILTKIRSMIRRARVSRSLPDTGTYPITQVEFLGKTSNMVVIWPYGMSGQLPEDAETICFNIEGMEENKAGIGTVPKLRLKVNADGEVVFGNPLTESAIYFRENGDIEVIGKNNQNITVDGDANLSVGANYIENITGDKTENITGHSTENVTGDKDISADNTTVTSTVTTDVISPAVNLGDLLGKLLMTDDIISIYNGHKHPLAGGIAQPTTETLSASNATSKTKAS